MSQQQNNDIDLLCLIILIIIAYYFIHNVRFLNMFYSVNRRSYSTLVGTYIIFKQEKEI